MTCILRYCTFHDFYTMILCLLWLVFYDPVTSMTWMFYDPVLSTNCILWSYAFYDLYSMIKCLLHNDPVPSMTCILWSCAFYVLSSNDPVPSTTCILWSCAFYDLYARILCLLWLVFYDPVPSKVWLVFYGPVPYTCSDMRMMIPCQQYTAITEPQVPRRYTLYPLPAFYSI